MKKRLISFVFALCLIVPCLFMFTGCKEEVEDINQIQLDVKYYREYSGTSYYYEIDYIRFTESEMIHCRIDTSQATITPKIEIYKYQILDDNTICFVREYDEHTYAGYLKLSSKNFLIDSEDVMYVSENYLIENNLPYVKE